MNLSNTRIYLSVFLTSIILFSFPSCQDEPSHPDAPHSHFKQTKHYNSDVVTQWLSVQTSMLFSPTGNPFGFNPSRYMAYCGVALYESVLPGMPAFQTLHGQLTDMPAMPSTSPGRKYHWPTSANAALAHMTKSFFSTTTAYNEAAVLELENELNEQFRTQVDIATFDRSVAFGKEVATRIFEWSKSDNAEWPTSFTKPTGDGVWQSETGAPPVNPYWGHNRLMVKGSLDNAIAPPLTYSIDPASPYYKNMQEVYDVSQNLTREQKVIARYYNDSGPGFPAGSHYISILKQVIEQFKPALDKAAITYAKTGITLFDASTGSFKAKYTYWAERPFSFIRNVIAPSSNPAWKPFLTTPGFPDYPSNHAVFSTSVAHVLSQIYGDHTPFTNSTYEGKLLDVGNGPENLGSRHYSSFNAMKDEISMSRLYGGIHYRYSCEKGMEQGKKTAQNIDKKINFLKGKR